MASDTESRKEADSSRPERLHLQASGVWRLSFSTGAGFQGSVEVVNGLTGGVFHSQQTVFSHPATIKGLDL